MRTYYSPNHFHLDSSIKRRHSSIPTSLSNKPRPSSNTLEEFTDLRTLLARLYSISEWQQTSTRFYRNRMKKFLEESLVPLDILKLLVPLGIHQEPESLQVEN